MTKYYIQAETESGVLPLVIKGVDEVNIESVARKNYNIKSIISISTMPPTNGTSGIIQSSPIHALGLVSGGIRSSKRYSIAEY